MKTRWYRSLPFVAFYRECNVKIGEREIDDAYIERVPFAIALSNYRTLVHRKNIEETATRYRQLRVVGTAPIALQNDRNVNFAEIDSHEGKWLASMSVNRA